MQRGLFFAVALVLGSILAVTFTGESRPVTPLKGMATPEIYKKWHDVCLLGKTKGIDEQIKKFEAQIRKNPKDHLAEVYLGSSYALRAKYGMWGPKKLTNLRRAKKLMNSAVESAPNDPRVRMVRAIGYYKVPKRFKVRATSIADFKKIIPVAKKGDGSLKLNERQVILYYAHLAFQEEGQAGAAELKKICHQLAPNSKYGKLTR